MQHQGSIMSKKHQKGYLIANIILSAVFLLVFNLIFAGPLAQPSPASIIFTTAIWLFYACGYCVQSLAWKKGYNISFGWGYWFGIFAIFYWGFVPMEPGLQASIIEKAIRQAQQQADVQELVQPTKVEIPLCASCGAKLKSGASFCSQCGAKKE